MVENKFINPNHVTPLQWHWPSLGKRSIYKSRNSSLGDALKFWRDSPWWRKCFLELFTPKLKSFSNQSGRRSEEANNSFLAWLTILKMNYKVLRSAYQILNMNIAWTVQVNGVKPISAPLASQLSDNACPIAEEEEEMVNVPYSSPGGSLVYATVQPGFMYFMQ